MSAYIRVTRREGRLSTFKCHGCSKEHAIPLYVVARPGERVTHTCEDCGAQHVLYRRRVSPA